MASTNIDLTLAQLDNLDIKELTTAEIGGTGVFDVLMKTTALHIRAEYDANRITGPEYSQVYLGGLQATLATSVQYLNEAKLLGIRIKNEEKQGELIAAQTKLAEAQANQVKLETELKLPAEVENIKATTLLTDTNRDRVKEEMKLIPKQGDMLTAQIGQVGKQTELVNVQIDQLTQELAKIPVEVQILEKQLEGQMAQIDLTKAQTEGVELSNTKIPKEIVLLEKQSLQADSAIALTTAQKDQIIAETSTRLPVEVENLTKQGNNLAKQAAMTEAQTAQITEQTKRFPYDIEEIQARIANMSKQTLIAEKDIELKQGQLELQEKQLLLSQAELEVKKQELEVQRAAVLSQQAQAELYTQKVKTEKAQTEGSVAQPGSVLGANVAVLMAQADGYTSDKLQKATKILVDTWNVRRNSDDGTEANVTNQLHDANIGVVVKGMMTDAGLTPIITG